MRNQEDCPGLHPTATTSARSRCPRSRPSRALASRVRPDSISGSPGAAWGIHFRRFVLPSCRSGHGFGFRSAARESNDRRRTSRGLATRVDERSRVPPFGHTYLASFSGSAPTFSRASATVLQDNGPRATGEHKIQTTTRSWSAPLPETSLSRSPTTPPAPRAGVAFAPSRFPTPPVHLVPTQGPRAVARPRTAQPR